VELPKYIEMLERFDDFVLTEIRIFGWRLLLSDLVLGRVAAWSSGSDPKGRRKLRRLGEELDLYLGIQLGQEKFPITDPGLYRLRVEAVRELDSLLKLSRAHFSSRYGWPSPAEMLSWIEKKIKSEHASFPTLVLELPNLIHFIGDLLNNKKPGSARLLQGDMREGSELFDLWFGARANRKPEPARQLISNLGREAKR
jgi:hypothetical protein